MGEHDVLEYRYMQRLKQLLSEHGVVLDYSMDRAAVDTGVHLFVEASDGSANASPARVWFQAKGRHAKSLSMSDFEAMDQVGVTVAVDHLRFWYAAPEAVYLVLYVESAGIFLAEDTRSLVERMWPRGDFYAAVERQQSVTVQLRTDAVLDSSRLAAMLDHRSMRIDGPAFRGRPLGHRLDPLRSVIRPPSPVLFEQLIDGLLRAHDFRETSRLEVSTGLKAIRGELHETLLWQSPAFTQYGYSRDPSELRVQPAPESLYGAVHILLDTTACRLELAETETAFVERAATAAAYSSERIVVIHNAPNLSSTGGLWRSTMSETMAVQVTEGWAHLGLEEVSSLMLTATLVYLDVAPRVSWNHVNFLA